MLNEGLLFGEEESVDTLARLFDDLLSGVIDYPRFCKHALSIDLVTSEMLDYDLEDVNLDLYLGYSCEISGSSQCRVTRFSDIFCNKLDVAKLESISHSSVQYTSVVLKLEYGKYISLSVVFDLVKHLFNKDVRLSLLEGRYLCNVDKSYIVSCDNHNVTRNPRISHTMFPNKFDLGLPMKDVM